MSQTDGSYQAKVGIEQGSETIFVGLDGKLKFFDEDMMGEQLKYILAGNTHQNIICNSGGVLSVVNLPSCCRVVIFSVLDTKLSNGSACLTSTSAVVGTEMDMLLRGVGNNASIHVTFSGVTVRGRLASGALSSIKLYGSSNSTAFLRLLCTDDSEWSVIEGNASVIEQAAS